MTEAPSYAPTSELDDGAGNRTNSTGDEEAAKTSHTGRAIAPIDLDKANLADQNDDKARQLEEPKTPVKTSPAESAQASPRPKLQGKATTAVSLTDVHTPEPARATSRLPSRRSSNVGIGRHSATRSADLDDNASVRSIQSFSPSVFAGGDVESLLGDILDRNDLFHKDVSTAGRSSSQDRPPLQHDAGPIDIAFEHEFEEINDWLPDLSNEVKLLQAWHSKLKHFLILSSAGKPIFSRHGDDQLISNTIGVVQTIISTFQGETDTLRSFKAGSTRFAILSKGHLHLVATTRLPETDAQLQAQLDALYMQILSTLTLPKLEKMFLNRPSMDLRRPLQGNEPLLSALADSFTRGSPTTLLSALECLRLRKAHRVAINNCFVKCRSPALLYGLIVAGGRLVSVLRPRKHSLHPGDLQLVFNMLFSASGVRASGGENWIPVCLPGFNNTGYLYMYVRFRSALHPFADTNGPLATATEESPPSSGEAATPLPPVPEHEIATILISTRADAFTDLRDMDTSLVRELDSAGCLSAICAAIGRGRASITDVLGSISQQHQSSQLLSHFLYKSRAHVQLAMPSVDGTYFASGTAWRRLMSVYARLHGVVHARGAHAKAHAVRSAEFAALAWVSPAFEVYCVAGPDASTDTLKNAAARVVRWAKSEEERLFIVGGAVF